MRVFQRSVNTDLNREAGQSDGGSTLVELLVAMTIFALLSALLIEVLSGARQLLRVRDTASSEGSMAAVRMAISNLVSGARPIRQLSGSVNEGMMLDGKKNVVRFVTGYAPKGQYGGLYESVLRGETAGDGSEDQNLVLEQSLYRAPKNGFAQQARPLRRSILLDGVSSITFKYYGRLQPQQNRRWSEAWSSATALPERVSIEVTFANSSARTWHPLIVELPLSN
jgi:type II secretion system protein J